MPSFDGRIESYDKWQIELSGQPLLKKKGLVVHWVIAVILTCPTLVFLL